MVSVKIQTGECTMSIDSKIFLTLIGVESLMGAIAKEIHLEEATISEPQPLDAMADMVDSPLGPEEIKMLLEFVTVALTLGTATMNLIVSLKKLIAKSEVSDSGRIVIVSAKTNEEIISITKHTDPEQACRAIAAASGR
jgi:hypothetical protein